MADVAKAAGCSQATVSLVLNDVTEVQISADLKARVILAARDLGYGVSGDRVSKAFAGVPSASSSISLQRRLKQSMQSKGRGSYRGIRT